MFCGGRGNKGWIDWNLARAFELEGTVENFL